MRSIRDPLSQNLLDGIMGAPFSLRSITAQLMSAGDRSTDATGEREEKGEKG